MMLRGALCSYTILHHVISYPPGLIPFTYCDVGNPPAARLMHARAASLMLLLGCGLQVVAPGPFEDTTLLVSEHQVKARVGVWFWCWLAHLLCARW